MNEERNAFDEVRSRAFLMEWGQPPIKRGEFPLLIYGTVRQKKYPDDPNQEECGGNGGKQGFFPCPPEAAQPKTPMGDIERTGDGQEKQGMVVERGGEIQLEGSQMSPSHPTKRAGDTGKVS